MTPTIWSCVALVYLQICASFADERVNLALGRPAFQYNDYLAAAASRAVDGRVVTTSCTLGSDIQPWWAVELDSPRVITTVRVTNDRNLKHVYRLDNFVVGLSNTPPKVGDPLSSNSYVICGRYPDKVPLWGTVTVHCAPNHRQAFKYVIIQSSLPGKNALCLSEVAVYSEYYACNDSPCKNGATCINNGQTSFTCQCAKGWKGNDCSQEMHICEKSNPCQNNGICVKEDTDYRCSCRHHWAGDHCEIGHQQCKMVRPKARINCGWSGVTQDECSEQGCCYDPSMHNKPACFHPYLQCQAIPQNERANCGWHGISYMQCISRGCCFDVEGKNRGPLCFRKAPTHCVGVKAEHRRAVGSPKITPNECVGKGWCYDTSISPEKGPWCFIPS